MKIIPVPKMKSREKQLQEFHNIRYRFKTVLTNLQRCEQIDGPIAFTLRNRMTVIIEDLIQKDCQQDNGILMKQMLKLEADLAIAGYLIQFRKASLIYKK